MHFAEPAYVDALGFRKLFIHIVQGLLSDNWLRNGRDIRYKQQFHIYLYFIAFNVRTYNIGR